MYTMQTYGMMTMMPAPARSPPGKMQGEHIMYSGISVDRKDLTIMGVPFPDAETSENTAYAIGSSMFGGSRPARKGVEMIRITASVN